MLSLIAWTPGVWELMIIAGVALLCFGHRLPSMMNALGQSVNSFKAGLRSGEAETEKTALDTPS